MVWIFILSCATIISYHVGFGWRLYLVSLPELINASQNVSFFHLLMWLVVGVVSTWRRTDQFRRRNCIFDVENEKIR